MLHLRKEVPHRPGVNASSTTTRMPGRLLGRGQRGLGHNPADVARSLVPQRRRQGPHSCVGGGDTHGVVLEELGDIGRDPGERRLHAVVRRRSPVPEPQHPLAGMVTVVVDLLDRFGRHTGDRLVARGDQRGIQLALVGGEPQHPRHLETEVAAFLLDQVNVVKVPLVSQVGQLVLGAAGPVELTGSGQQHPRLAEQVETDVTERHILFDLRSTADPLTQSLCVDERVVPELQAVCRRDGGRAGGSRGDVGHVAAHRYSTSSGTS